MMAKVCNAPVNLYFDVTPVTRIINTFTIDLKQVDSFLVEQSQSLISKFYTICGVLVMTYTNVPSLLVVLFLMAVRSVKVAGNNDKANR